MERCKNISVIVLLVKAVSNGIFGMTFKKVSDENEKGFFLLVFAEHLRVYLNYKTKTGRLLH